MVNKKAMTGKMYFFIDLFVYNWVKYVLPETLN